MFGSDADFLIAVDDQSHSEACAVLAEGVFVHTIADARERDVDGDQVQLQWSAERSQQRDECERVLTARKCDSELVAFGE